MSFFLPLLVINFSLNFAQWIFRINILKTHFKNIYSQPFFLILQQQTHLWQLKGAYHLNFLQKFH